MHKKAQMMTVQIALLPYCRHDTWKETKQSECSFDSILLKSPHLMKPFSYDASQSYSSLYVLRATEWYKLKLARYYRNSQYATKAIAVH